MNGIPPTSTLNGTLEALEGMPSLNYLSLCSVIPRRDQDTNTVVQLRHLQTLHLVDLCSSCISLLQHISYPPTAAVSVIIPSHSNEELAQLGSEISAKLPGSDSSFPGIQGLTIDRIAGAVSISAWRKKIYDTEMQTRLRSNNSSYLVFDVVLRGATHDLESNVAHLRASLPLSNVETINLRTWGSPDAMFKELSDAMPDVKELAITSDEKSDWKIPRLLVVRPTKPDIPALPPLFPSLAVLTLSGMKFREHSDCRDKSELMMDLRKMLKSRQSSGRKIKTLAIGNAVNLDGRDLHNMHRVVGEVKWDPKRVSWEDPDEDDVDENPGRSHWETGDEFSQSESGDDD